MNSEAFQIIDEGSANTDVEIRFGDSLNEKLYWDRANGQFRFSDDLYVDLNLEVAGSMSGQSLTVSGTGAKFGVGQGASGSVQPLLATDLDYGAIVIGTGGLRNSGTGTMMPQLYVAGRSDVRLIGSVDAGAGLQSPYSVFVAGRYAYMANGDGDTLGVYDTSNPSSPLFVGSVDAGAGLQGPNDVFVQGRYAYMANSDGDTLGVYDISNPSSPKRVGSVDAGAGTQRPRSVFVQGRYAYMANYIGDTLGVYDISNPFSPLLVGSVDAGAGLQGPDDVFVAGRYAYMANIDGDTLGVYDISNPSSPLLVGSVDAGAGTQSPRSVFVQGRYAYMANYIGDTLGVYDISNPSSPLFVSSLDAGAGYQGPRDVFVAGRYAYMANGDGDTLGVYDTSNPSSPLLVGSVDAGAGTQAPFSVFVSGRYAYMANGAGDTLGVYDLGGLYVQQLEAGGIETSTLSVRTNAHVFNDLDVRGGLGVGRGINATGPSGIVNTSTGSFALRVTSATGGLRIGAQGTTLKPHLEFGTGTTFDVNLYRSAANTLKTDDSFQVVGTVSGTTLTFMGGNSYILGSLIIGATTIDSGIKLEVVGTISGSVIKATNNVTSSGSLWIEGGLSGATLAGGGLYDCDDGTNSKLLWDQTTRKFSCGSDLPGSSQATADERYVQEAGDTMTGTLHIRPTAGPGTLGLNVAAVMSGRSLTVTGTGTPLAPLLATDIDYGSLVVGTGGLRNSGTGTMMPQLAVTGRVPVSRVGSGSTVASPQEIAVQGRYAYVVTQGTDDRLRIFDVSNATNPLLVGSVAVGNDPESVAVAGRYAYTANASADTMSIVDVGNPASPAVVSTLAVGDRPVSVVVAGRTAYLTHENSQDLWVVDVGNPAAPVKTSSIGVGALAEKLFVAGRYAYIAVYGNNELRIYDVGNPAAPVLASSSSTGLSNPYAVFVQGRYAYVASYGNSRLVVFDVANPASPVNVGTLTTGISNPRFVAVQGRYAYVANEGGALTVVDVSNPSRPSLVGTVTSGTSPVALSVAGRYAYVSNNGSKSFSVYDLGGAYVQQMEAGGVEAGSLSVRTNAQIFNDLDVRGGLGVGRGINATGPSGITNTSTGSFALRVTSATGAVRIGAQGTTLKPHMEFGTGSTFDTNLYRSAANTLKTDDSFQVVGTVSGTTLSFMGGTSYILGTLSIGGSTIKSGLRAEVYGTLSGSAINVSNTLSSSGAVYLEGSLTGATIAGFGLPGGGCTGSNKLLWDSATGKFSCATDAGGSSISQTDGDSRYVNVSGDTMTGALNVRVTNGGPTTLSVNVAGLMSGASLRVSGTGAQPLLATDIDYGSLVVGTGGLRNSGTGTMMPQLYVAGRVPTARVGSGSTGTGPRGVAVQGRYAYITTNTSNTLEIFDVSNSSTPQRVSTITTGTYPADVAIQGSYAYVVNQIGASTSTLQIVDVGNPAVPQIAGSTLVAGLPNAVTVAGRYAYVTGTSNDLEVFDVSNPAAPLRVASGALAGTSGNDIVVQGKYAYVAVYTSADLDIFDVSNPHAPVRVSSTNTSAQAAGIAVQGRYAYVAARSGNRFNVLDIANPSSPVLMATINPGGNNPVSVSVQGRYAYIADEGSSEMKAIDISNPSSPFVVGTVATGLTPLQITVAGRYAYVTNNGAKSFHIFDLGGAYVQQLEAGGIEAGTLSVRTNASIFNDLDVGGGLTAGRGINATGPSGIVNTSTGSFVLRVTSATGAVRIGAQGTTLKPHLEFGTGSTFDTNLYRSAANTLKTDDAFWAVGTVSGTTLNFMGGTSYILGTLSIGGSTIKSGLRAEVYGTLSGSHVKVSNTLSASGAVYLEGSLTGATIAGFGLPSGGCTGGNKLLWDSATGKFSCAADAGGSGISQTDGDARYVNQSGDTMTGALNVRVTNGGPTTLSVNVAGLMSGAALRVSGTGAKFSPATATGTVQPLLATDIDYGAIVIGTGGLRNAGTGTMMPQLYVAGRSNIVRVGSGTSNIYPTAIAVQGRYAYTTNSNSETLNIFDVSNPSSPVQVGSVSTEGGTNPDDVAVQGRYAYIANYNNSTLGIFDVSNPASPTSVGSVSTGAASGPTSVFVQGRYAYTANLDSHTLSIFDISNPSSPVQVGSVSTGAGTSPSSVFIQGRYAYTANSGNNTLEIIDISNPTSPFPVSSISTGGGTIPESVFVQGRYAYVANSSGSTLGIFDVSNPASPVSIGSVSTGAASGPASVFVQGRYAYTANHDSHTLSMFDVSNPSSPIFVGSVFAGESGEPVPGPSDIVVQGRYAYTVSSNEGGRLQIFDLGGAYIQQLEAGGIEAGSLSVRTNASVFNDLDVRGGVGVGRGINVTGPSGITNTSTGSFALRVTSATGALRIGAQGTTLKPHLEFGTGSTFDTNLYRSAANTLKTDDSFQVVGTVSGTTLNFMGGTSYILGTLSIGGSTIKSGLRAEVYGTLSGAAINVSNTLSSSGAVYLEGSLTGATIAGFGLPGGGCTGGNKLLWDSATGKFSCATDAGGSSISQTDGDSRYVNVSGDTMTGALNVRVTNGGPTTLSVNVAGLMSGAALRVSGTGSKPLLATDIDYGSLVMGSGSLRNSGTGTMMPQLAVTGRLPGARTGSGSTGNSPRSIAVQGRYAYVTNTGSNTLQIFDISSPGSVQSVGSFTTGSTPYAVAVAGQYAYVVNNGAATLQIVNVSNPASPVLAGSVATNASPVAVNVVGRYAYVTAAGASDTLQIFDVGNPAAPVATASVATGNDPASIFVQGRYAYVVNQSANTLQVFDAGNPYTPRAVGSLTVGTAPMAVTVAGRYAYIVNNGGNTLQIVDVSNPASPASIATVTTGTAPVNLFYQDRVVYVTNYGSNTLQTFDVSNPSAPVSLGTVATGTAPYGLSVQGRYAIVTNAAAKSLHTFDLGGAYVQQLEAGGIEAGTLSVRTNASVFNDLDIGGGLTVGRGINATGPSGITNTSTGSFALTVTSATGALRIGAQGTTLKPHLEFGTGSTFDTNLYRSAANTLKTDDSFHAVGTVSGTTLTFMGGTSYILGTLSIGGSTIKSGLRAEVYGTLSGSAINVSNTLSSSGAVYLESSLTGATIAGFGLPSGGCTGSNKLLWDSATGKFSCATDQGGSGITQSDGDSRYVNVSGDTMTGALNVRVTNGGPTTLSVNVAGLMSGASLHVSGTGAKFSPTTATGMQVPLLATDLDYGAIVMGTGGLRNSGTGTMMPQLAVVGRVPVQFTGSGKAGLSGARAVSVAGRYAYVTSDNNNSLVVFDVSNPSSPLNIGSATTGLTSTRDVVVKGGYAYVVGNNSLVIFDITNPASPVRVGSASSGLSGPQYLAVQGRYAYVTSNTNNSLVIFDVSNPASPVQVGSDTSNLTLPKSITVQGRYAYVANYGANGLVIFDVSNPASPIRVASSTTNLFAPISITVQGRYAYIANEGGDANLTIFDVSNPSSPVSVSTTKLGNSPLRSVAIQGRYAYIVSADNDNRLIILDVSNPRSPVRVGFTTSGLSTPQHITVQGRYAYVANYGNNNLTIFDLGGAYVQQLEAGGIEAGTLSVRANAQVFNDLDVGGELAAGRGINTTGPSGITNTSTGSFALRVTSATGAVRIGAQGTTLKPHLEFGTGTTFDTNLYRSAANTLKTDDSFSIVGTASGTTLTFMGGTSYILGSLAIGTTSVDNGLKLEVVGMMSGRSLQITAGDIDVAGRGAPLLFTNVGGGRVGIKTTTPHADLDIVRTASAATIVTTTFSGAGLVNCNSSTAKLLWDSSTERFSCGTDQTGTTMTTVKKTSDQTITSDNTIGNDSELFFTSVAGATYHIQAYLRYVTGSSPDFKYGIEAPAGSMVRVLANGYTVDGDAVISCSIGTTTRECAQTDNNAHDGGIDLTGYIYTAAGGTVAIDWAQNTSNSAQTTVQSGSVLRYIRTNP